MHHKPERPALRLSGRRHRRWVRPDGRYAVAALVVGALVLSACVPSQRPSKPRTSAAPISFPVAKTGEVTFYLSLPSSLTNLTQAAGEVASPGSGKYRLFSSLAQAASQFGATDAQVNAVAASIKTLGLRFAADPTRLFGRVTGTTAQWLAALETPLLVQPATASSPFVTYGLPNKLPAALQPSGTSLVMPEAQVYDPIVGSARARAGTPLTATRRTADAADPKAAPWPLNSGTPVSANCSASAVQHREVYTEQQVQTAYGVDALRGKASGTPVITIVDLGGGWLPGDLELAGRCFGYSPPAVNQVQGDGVATAISGADPETALDLQTAAAVAPGAEMRLVQTTPVSLVDAFSRAIGDSRGVPDAISVSYGGCALTENRTVPGYVALVDAVLAMGAMSGVSTFVAAGDAGSTTCGTGLGRTTLSFPAVSPFVTAVGGTRLALGAGNTRVSETVWNDTVYGQKAAGGGGVSRLESRPSYQDGANAQPRRAIPDVSALADIVPGWPVVLNSALQPVGGTSGSTPFVAAATALVAATERKAGRPPIGLANGWFYQAASRPSTFYDVTHGSNDLAGVGCCEASVGYDPASGLGVPNWATLPAALPAAD